MVREKLSVKFCCKVLKVSRSGYYSWIGRPESFRRKENEKIIAEMKQIHEESRRTYGLPRIQAKLKSLGRSCGKSRLSTLMKTAGISGIIRRRFKVKTTDSNHSSPVAERTFKTEDRVTHPIKPNQIWASDISYVATEEGFLFLATYLDLYTRKIVGFSTADHMRTELVLSALEMGLGRQKLAPEGILTHTDRGSQYASELYREKLSLLGIRASMSRKGNCWDNAYAESFFATLKKELIYRKKYKTKEEARKSIFEFIEVWYNRNRIHSSIGYMTPVQYEESLAA